MIIAGWPMSTVRANPFGLYGMLATPGMDCGLLGTRIMPTHRRRERMDVRRLQQACHSRRLMVESSGFRAFGPTQRQRPDGGEYDYSSLSGFRIARTLP